MFVSLSHVVPKSPLVERPAVKPPMVTELDNEGEAVRPPASSAKIRPCMEDHRPILYRAKAPRLSSVDDSSVKKKKAYSSMVKTDRRSKEVMKSSPEEKRVKSGAERLAKTENLVDTTPAVLDASQPESESTFQV